MRINSEVSPGAAFARDAPISLLLFCFFLVSYSLFIYGNVRFGDEAERYFQARSLIDAHSLVIPLIPGEGTTGVGNQAYSQFEMGYGLLLLPFYALGKMFSLLVPFGDHDWVPLLFVSLSNPVITSLTCLLLYWLSRSLGMHRKIAVLTVMVYGLGTIAFPYARALYREPTQALGLIGAVYAAIKFRQTGQSRQVLVCGASFGYLALTKVANMFMLPFFPIYLLFASSQTRRADRLRSTARHTALFIIPVFLLLTFQGLVNVAKFGDFFNIGPYNYGNPLPYFSAFKILDGVGGLLFSSGKGLFVFSPPAVLFVPAWIVFFKRQRVEASLILALVVSNILFAASYVGWDGGTYWGPRYLVLIVPLMILPLGFLLQETKGLWRRLWAGLTAVVFLAGLGVQFLGVLSNDREYTDVTGKTIDLAGAWETLRHGALESLVFSLSPVDGLHVSIFGWIMLALVAVLLVWVLVHLAQDERPWQLYRALAAGGVLVAVLFVAFLIGVVTPYPRVLAAKGDTKYVAANAYFGENQFCKAQSFYTLALSLGTSFQQESIARLQEITPAKEGTAVELGDLRSQMAEESRAQVERDRGISMSQEQAVRIRLPEGTAANVETTTDFVRVRPDTRYEVSGWYRSEGVAGSGYGVVAWYEDDAKWQQRRTLDLIGFSGTQGWQQFRQTVTTLPTTKRALLKAGLWQATGTIWIDGLRLVQVEGTPPPSLCVR